MPATHAPAPAVDWNVCIGYLTAEHAFPEADLRPSSFLCPACDDRLNGAVDAARTAAPARCMGGDHAPGSAYHTCLACYGD